MSFELILPFLRPIEPLLLDESISEIMGNPDASWWYERDGIMRQETSISFNTGQLRTGLTIHYSYNAQNMLAAVTDADGQRRHHNISLRWNEADTGTVSRCPYS
jgi:YD repeat-containing protein